MLTRTLRGLSGERRAGSRRSVLPLVGVSTESRCSHRRIPNDVSDSVRLGSDAGFTAFRHDLALALECDGLATAFVLRAKEKEQHGAELSRRASRSALS